MHLSALEAQPRFGEAGFRALEGGLGRAQLGFAQHQVRGGLVAGVEPLPLLRGNGGFLSGQVELVTRLRHLGHSLLDGELIVAWVQAKEQCPLGKSPAGFEISVLPHHNTRHLRHEVDLSVGPHRALPLHYDLDLLERSGNGFDERTHIGG